MIKISDEDRRTVAARLLSSISNVNMTRNYLREITA